MQPLFSPNKNMFHDAETASDKNIHYNPTMTLVPLTVQKEDDSGLTIKWYLNYTMPVKKFKSKELTS